MGTELIFVRAVPRLDHRRLWSRRGTARIKNGPGKSRVRIVYTKEVIRAVLLFVRTVLFFSVV